MKEQIKALVKTAYAKFGLKEASLEKLVNIIEQKVNAMGALEPEKLTEAINGEITAYEPFVGLIQSEVDSRVQKPTPPKPSNPTPQEPQEPLKQSDEMPQWAKDLQKQNEELRQKLEVADKQKSIDQIKNQAIELAKKEGATNDKLLQKVIRLVSIEDGFTAEQVSKSLITEYNELYTTTTEGVVPSVPSQPRMSEADLAKKREEAAKTSKENLLKDKQF